MQNILVFSGTKQSGKSTAAKYITGLQMQKAGSIKEFGVDNDGHLVVNTSYLGPKNEVVETTGVLDIYRSDLEFLRFASEKIWPFCKVYSFATMLKESAINIFGLNPDEVYGSDEDKNKLTKIKWSDLSALTGRTNVPDGYMTNRQVLQEFGTICRKLKDDCWISSAFNMIRAEGYPNVVIDDGRYENEVDYANTNGAKTVLLTLHPFKDDVHDSEKIHQVDRKKFNFVIDNANMTLDQKHDEIDKILLQTGWTTGTIS